MKITRKHLLITILSCGAFLIIYSLLREFLHIDLGESFSKSMPNAVFIVAIGLFLWNRQLAKDEEKEAAKNLEKKPQASDAEKTGGASEAIIRDTVERPENAPVSEDRDPP